MTTDPPPVPPSQPPPQPSDARSPHEQPQQQRATPGLLANLGAMVGHVVKAIRTDVTQTTQTLSTAKHVEPVETSLGPGQRVVTTTEQMQATAPRAGTPGQIIARKTTVEEVRVDQAPTPPASSPPVGEAPPDPAGSPGPTGSLGQLG